MATRKTDEEKAAEAKAAEDKAAEDKAAEDKAAEDKAKEKEKAAAKKVKDDEAAAKKAAQYKKDNPTYAVAEGKSITSKKGILGPGDTVEPDMLGGADGNATLLGLIESGHVVKD